MLKMIAIAVTSLGFLAAAGFGGLWLQDWAYEPYEFPGVLPEDRRGVLGHLAGSFE